MRSGSRSVSWSNRLPQADAALRASVLRVTARNERVWGFVLARLREARRESLAEQAAALGASENAVVFLSTFRLPRPGHHNHDLAATATAIGIEAGVLRALLRAGRGSGAAATAPVGGAA